MPALIDLTKGHHQHGKLTIHSAPALCPIVPTLIHTMPVTSDTCSNGIASGQWIQCMHCQVINRAAYWARKTRQENQ